MFKFIVWLNLEYLYLFEKLEIRYIIYYVVFNDENFYFVLRYLENEVVFGVYYRWGMIYMRWV